MDDPSIDQLRQLVCNGFEASFLPEDEKQASKKDDSDKLKEEETNDLVARLKKKAKKANKWCFCEFILTEILT